MDHDHLRVALAGARSVNGWREAHPQLVLDLSRADLRHANLRGADLSGCDLLGADLFDAQCEGTCFRRADLRTASVLDADLRGADLRAANLVGANLSMDARVGGTRLDGADLTDATCLEALFKGSTLVDCVLDNADLCGAMFVDCAVSGSSWVGAMIGGTTFANVDLSAVTGLLALKFRGPSSIGVDTIVRSKGQLPEAFLRGCGCDPAVQTLLFPAPRKRAPAKKKKPRR